MQGFPIRVKEVLTVFHKGVGIIKITESLLTINVVSTLRQKKNLTTKIQKYYPQYRNIHNSFRKL